MQGNTYTCLEKGLNSGVILHSFVFSCLSECLAVDCLVPGSFVHKKAKWSCLQRLTEEARDEGQELTS